MKKTDWIKYKIKINNITEWINSFCFLSLAFLYIKAHESKIKEKNITKKIDIFSDAISLLNNMDIFIEQLLLTEKIEYFSFIVLL